MELYIMKIPQGFKIKKKSDINIFINECMQNENEYVIILNSYEAIALQKDNDVISFLVKNGNVRNPFIPYVKIAETNNLTYAYTIEECIWKYRKYINKEWFSKNKTI